VWPGALILNIGLDAAGEAVSFAANIAGAVCLSLESDPALLRNAQRTGSCDFVVNTLDEALRAMKNEVRKRLPLSVGLAADPAKILAEATERGLAPQLFTAPEDYPEAAVRLRSFGAQTLSFARLTDPAPEPDSAAAILAATLAEHAWRLQSVPFPNSTAVRAFDARALTLLDPDEPADRLRRQWLLAAARILPRDRHRTLWLTAEEAATIAIPPA
jgi:urocanate hydratase